MIERLQPRLAQVSDGIFYPGAVQDIVVGARQSNAQYQYTLLSDSVEEVDAWTPKLVETLERSSALVGR